MKQKRDIEKELKAVKRYNPQIYPLFTHILKGLSDKTREGIITVGLPGKEQPLIRFEKNHYCLQVSLKTHKREQGDTAFLCSNIVADLRFADTKDRTGIQAKKLELRMTSEIPETYDKIAKNLTHIEIPAETNDDHIVIEGSRFITGNGTHHSFFGGLYRIGTKEGGFNQGLRKDMGIALISLSMIRNLVAEKMGIGIDTLYQVVYPIVQRIALSHEPETRYVDNNDEHSNDFLKDFKWLNDLKETILRMGIQKSGKTKIIRIKEWQNR